MNGREVLVKALLTSADRHYTIPGYPVTEIGESLNAEIVINEKTALEYALGDSLSGRRSVVIIKNVGLNSCADVLVNATNQGLSAGVVVVVGDDSVALGSQNIQDSRYYGEVAQVPVIEPDGKQIGDSVETAFFASEQFSRISLLRVTPEVLDGPAEEGVHKRESGTGTVADPALTMYGRAVAADITTGKMFEWARTGDLSGGLIAYPPSGSELPETFAECGRRFVQEHRNILPPVVDAYPETMQSRGYCRTFCRNCPFAGTIAIMKEKGMQAVCDIGCSVLAKNPPYQVGTVSYALGSSIAVATRSTGIALTGDYALLHSGINALIDVYEKEMPLLSIVLKNNCMGMTGGHSSPDILKYIQWADPIVLCADDEDGIRESLSVCDDRKLVVIEGACPEGEYHETLEC